MRNTGWKEPGFSHPARLQLGTVPSATSMTRDDVGSGACEVIWVESVEVEP